MHNMKVRTEHLPKRCEICHQSDAFDSEANHCSRCDVALLPIPLPQANLKTSSDHFANLNTCLKIYYDERLTIIYGTKKWINITAVILMLLGLLQYLPLPTGTNLISLCFGGLFFILLGRFENYRSVSKLRKDITGINWLVENVEPRWMIVVLRQRIEKRGKLYYAELFTSQTNNISEAKPVRVIAVETPATLFPVDQPLPAKVYVYRIDTILIDTEKGSLLSRSLSYLID